jgi:fructose-1,6-bisphosphatase II / sedoheptulose-1,7-bisphosphatase
MDAQMTHTDFNLDTLLAMDAARVTEAAAIAAAAEVGRGNEKHADQVAVDAMRTALNALAMDGTVVIGEGERDEAPMLYIGEKVGTGQGPAIDIALDPLEGTTLTAKAMPNALAVVAFAPKGGLMNAPDTYMDKIAIGPGYAKGLIDLDASAIDNVMALAKAKGVKPSELGVCIMERPRHDALIAAVRSTGARVFLITDGDVAGVINTTDAATGIDMYIGQGGAPEGVLAAAALNCIGGQFQGRLVFKTEDEKVRADKWGITDLNRKYDLTDLVRGPSVFAATGVTRGGLLDGVLIHNGMVETHSLVMSSATQTVRTIKMKRPVS